MVSQAAPSLPAVGELVGGKYRVTRVLGQGGMGAVFAAQHEILGQEVALKLLLAEALREPEAVKRFLNEARAAAKIHGEHVVRVLDVGLLEDGRPFISMELLEGQDLGAILEKNGALQPTVAVDFLLQAMEAIAQAHALGIVHRDLKPSNLFLTARPDGTSVIKVLDFGIAKAAGGDPNLQAQTSTRAMMGSPLYMSPEQIRSAKSADAQSDVWALGAVGYELVTGSPPFDGESLGELLLAIVERVPPPAHHRNAGVPPGLGDVLARCLERDRAVRFAGVAELAAALAPFASQQGAASAERIAATLARMRNRTGSLPDASAGLASSPRLPPGGVTPSSVNRVAAVSTNDSWAGSPSPPVARPTRVALFLVLGGVGLAAGIGAVALVARGHAPSTVAAPPPTAPATPAPTVAPSASTAPAPTVESPPPSPSASAPPVASSPPARPATPARPGSRTPGKPGAPGITTNKEWF
ncbi:MAG TPA: serine/threonine-protein kinase [Polyangiaceae bacterium]|jgi:serine/threonine-protein kinase